MQVSDEEKVEHLRVNTGKFTVNMVNMSKLENLRIITCQSTPAPLRVRVLQ
jgi:hypothetical protein